MFRDVGDMYGKAWCTIIRTMAITHDHKVVKELHLLDISLDDYDFVWTDFSAPTEQESQLLHKYFQFHPLAIEDCLHVLQRPKLDYYEDIQFMVLHAIRQEEEKPHEVDLFLGPKLLVSYHHEPLDELDQAWERIGGEAERRTIWSRAPIAAAYTVMDKLVDGYFPVLFAIEDELAELEGRSGNAPTEELVNQVFLIRSKLLHLRKTIVPMRDLLYRIINSQHIQGQSRSDHKLYFINIYDHLLKLTDMLEADREMTADLRDSYISLNSDRMNSIMKTLTVITTLFMPLTLIAGIYGMNFHHMPELSYRYGYTAVIVGMILLGCGMMIWFKKRGWFK
ncbi:magnesium transporter [Paenibacillus sp. 453mf]|nr:magnesium transporter [Paenibacillus sp. 453mf]